MARLKCVISAVLLCTAIVFFSTSANADTTYTYTGQRLTNVERSSCEPTPCIITGTNFSIDGSITVASPLAANLNDAPVNFTSFAFSSEGLTDTSAEEEALAAEPAGDGGGPFPIPGLFNVSTNASGQIDQWLISLPGIDLGGPPLAMFTGFELSVCPNPHPRNCIFAEDTVLNATNETDASNENQPGAWSMSTTGATVPEPSSALLLGVALLGVAGLALMKKPTLKSITSAFCFCLLLTLCAVSAKADTTYTYRGNPFTVIQCILPLTNCVGSSIDGSFTLASPLGDNLNNAFVNPQSYSFEGDGIIDSNLNVPRGNSPTFEFSTNASGQIEGWGVLLTGFQQGSPLGEVNAEFEIFSNPSGVLCPCFPFLSADDISVSIGGLSYNLGPPGTWTVSGVPEPASGTLLIAGLVGLAGLALKKSL
jgi:hypothetical protein